MNQPPSDGSSGWLTGLGITIAGSGSSSPGSSGPGFTMSHDDAHSMLALAKQARTQFGAMRLRADRLAHTTSPADEPASNSYNARLVGSGPEGGAFGAGADKVQHMYDYADELVGKLETALGLTRSADEAAAHHIKATGSGQHSTGRAG